MSERLAPLVWLEHDLPAARRAAHDRAMPLLVFWTAPWCPPCNEFKLKVFDHPAFGDAVRGRWQLLHINGDQPGAQAHGEALAVESYPCVLIFDAAGAERMRVPGGIGLARFMALLELGMGHADGVDAALRRAQAGIFRAEDAALAAWHWWSVDGMRRAAVAREGLLLRGWLHALAVGSPERQRLIVQALVLAQSEPEAAAVPMALRATLATELRTAFETPPRFEALYLLIVDPTVLAGVADEGSAERLALERALLGAVERLRADATLSDTERLIVAMAQFTLAERVGAPFDAAATAAWAQQRAHAAEGVAARQTVVNMAGHLLHALGQPAAARALFEAQCARSPYGTYFMPSLAAWCEEAGDRAGALHWARRAYDETPASATRFGHGVRYLGQCAAQQALSPEAFALALQALLTEVARASDGRLGMYRVVMGRLLAMLARWHNEAPMCTRGSC